MTDSQKIKLWAHGICVDYFEPEETLEARSPLSTKKALKIGNYLESKYGYEKTRRILDALIQKYKGILYPKRDQGQC